MKKFHSSPQNNNQTNISAAKKISFSAILCALGTIIMLLGSLIEVIDITMAAMASFLIVVCMIELKGYMPFLVYAVTSVLSFLLLPNKTVVFIYALFFGFYPILKNYAERRRPIVSWIIKFAIFNIFLFIYCKFAKELLFPDVENIELYVVLLVNVIFFTLDLTLSLFVEAYVKRFRKALRINTFFK